MKRALALLFALSAGVSAARAAGPEVVATIAPLHSIVAAVAGDAFAPRLLLDATVSPHTHQLRPSQARMLQQADMIVRIGPVFETFLETPIANLAQGTRVLSALELPLPVVLHYDEPHDHGGAAGDEHAHGHDHGDDHDHGHEHTGVDPHLWLEPANGAAIARAVAGELAALDPERATTYRANAEAFAARLADLREELADRLAPVRERGFASAHDAFRYFAHAFDLRYAGAFALDPEVPAGAATRAGLVRRIRSGDVACIAVEPQFEPAGLSRLARETGVAVAVLDPLGAGLTPGPGLYVELLRRNVEALAECLEAGRPG